MDRIVVTTLGGILIAFIYWFFFGKKETEGQVSDEIKIQVAGGYKPQVVKIPRDRQVKLQFTRTEENSCLEEVVFPDYKIKKYLPLNQAVEVTLNPPHKKQSEFHCGMSMYFGKVISK